MPSAPPCARSTPPCRTHEIGVRMAVGASRGRVLRLVLGDGVRLAAQAAALGLLGALAMTRSRARLLYGVGELDPAVSCRGRSLCPSCEKKRQLLWAEWLRE